MTGRAAWLRDLRRRDEEQEQGLAAEYDAAWGEVDEKHRAFIERFLQMLPPAWLDEAGFGIDEELEGPWVGGEYAYHHVLARKDAATQAG